MSDLHPITCTSLLEEADRAFRGDFSPLLDDVRMEIREHLDLMDEIEARHTAPVKERKRRLTYHHIVNLDDVHRGYDDTFRALCGATFPARHGLLAGDQPKAVTREWVKCAACDYMERLRDSFGL